jgi:hypothetical protein
MSPASGSSSSRLALRLRGRITGVVVAAAFKLQHQCTILLAHLAQPAKRAFESFFRSVRVTVLKLSIDNTSV